MAPASPSRPPRPASRGPASRGPASGGPASGGPASGGPASGGRASRGGASRAGAPAQPSAGRPANRAGATAQRSAGGPATGDGEPPKKGLRGFVARLGANLRQIGQVYKLTARTDKALPLWLAVAFAIGFLVVLGIGFLLGAPGYFAFLGVVVGLLVALVVFGRRAERAAYAQLEGRPGAAAAALDTLKRNWTITPAVAGTRSLEVVHRAVGRPGIVLVGEGPGRGRLTGLLQQEVRRHQRVAPGTPVLIVRAGTGEGEVPIARLPKHLKKLAAVLTPGDVRELDQRLKALRLGPPQTPHGPLPRGARLPKGLRPPTEADPTGR